MKQDKICKHCNEPYDLKTVGRIYGKESAVVNGNFCSAQCYTAHVTAHTEGKEGYYPGLLYLSPNSTYIRAKEVHGWNIAKIEDQPPYTKANAARIVKCWNEHHPMKVKIQDLEDTLHAKTEMIELMVKENTILKEQNRILKDIIEETDNYFNRKAWTAKGKLAKRIGEKIKQALNKLNS